MVKYRCDKCGREFPNKTPHKCLTGFQKRHLTYTRVYEDKPLFEEVDTNILELLKLIPKEEQRRADGCGRMTDIIIVLTAILSTTKTSGSARMDASTTMRETVSNYIQN